jgi:small subunit ribosomal protein S6
MAEAVGTVREYELTYLVGTGYTTAEMNSLQDEIVALIGKNAGEIVETKDWGKKTLAYPIKKDGKVLTEAVYSHLVIKLSPAKAKVVSKGVELKRQVLRSLLVLK